MKSQPLACVAVAICAATQATAQAPSIDLSSHTVETVVPPEFDGGFLHRVVEIVVKDNGVWVNDIGRMRLFQFDHTGRLVVEYGRQGSGPGELLLPGGLQVDSVVTVIDQRQRRIVRFGLDGEHIETRRLGAAVAGGAHVPVGWTVPLRNGVTAAVTLGWYAYGGNAVGEPFNHVLLAFPAGAGGDTIATYHFGNARWQADGIMGAFNPRFGEGGAWAAMGDSAIVVADGVTGLVAFYTARTPRPLANVSDISAWFAVDTVSLGFSARRVSPSDRVRAEREELRRAEPNLPAQVDIDGWPEHWSVATDLLVADDGNVWARQMVGGDGRQHWTEVDRYGTERLRYVLPERFRLLAVADGWLYGVALDEFQVQRVGRLQLTRTPRGPRSPR